MPYRVSFQKAQLLIQACLLFLFICLFASCAEDDGHKYRIGVSQCSTDAWRTKLNEEMRRELLFHPEISLEVRTADNDNERQAADIDYFIAQHIDLLVVSPNEAAQLTPAVSRAFDAGIPVIVADRKVTGEKYTAFVGGDNLAVGRLMGQYLLMQLPQGGKVLEVLGLPGSTPAELRHVGFMEALGDQAGKYEIMQLVGDFYQNTAEAAVRKALTEHPDVDIVMAQNDLMAIGARIAADAVVPGHHIIFMGVDGLTGEGNGVEAIAQGRVDASAVYSTGGDLIIQTAVRILNGEPFERNTELATYLIDAGTAPLMDNIYKEVDHEVETIHMLKGRVDYYWEQHNLEQALLYGLLAFLGVVIIFIILLYRNYYQKQLLNENLANQRNMLKEQRDKLAAQNQELTRLSSELEEATKAKLMFFTNVSHDFRTPLTLINGPLEQLLSLHASPANSATASQSYNLLRLAHKNVQVLLRLVNQILDFRKYESGKLELNLQPIALGNAVQEWFESFQGLAHKKHIKLDLKVKNEGLDVTSGADNAAFHTMGDLPKLERIFFNIMGNAFKFTPENGRISVELSKGENYVLRISDTGPGISVEHIQKIFENFYQIDSVHHEGSGIGLALVKSFVELHGGTVKAENQPVGTGTIFTVTLPVRPVTVTLAQEEQARAANTLQSQIDTELAEVLPDEEVSEEEPLPIALVIDDNQDIRSYIQALLQGCYRVLTAADGPEGIKKAMRVMPDVIVCDVMMPGMDGIEVSRRLKHEVNTCHIPILMLTACSLDEQRVQGLTEGGSDAYMSKPFNNDVLIAQLNSLVQNHNRVRDFFKEGTVTRPAPAATTKESEGKETPVSSPIVAASSLDDKFLYRLRELIDQNLSDSDFGVEQLGDQIGMSRAQLYRKCKALTNYSPVELIRNTRLKRAQQMLAQGDETISQVAYSVGFTAPSYFTKCYKDFFGEMPNELVKRKNGQ